MTCMKMRSTIRRKTHYEAPLKPKKEYCSKVEEINYLSGAGIFHKFEWLGYFLHERLN